MGIEFGTILNKNDPAVVVRSGPVAANTKLLIGLVYQDGANGWKNSPVDGSIPARRLYWNCIEIDNTGGALGDKTGSFYGKNACVVGKADGVINVGSAVKASESTGKNGQFQALADPTNPGASYSETEADSLFHYVLKKVAGYIGHVNEIKSIDKLATNAADGETNVVFVLEGGYA